MVDAAEESILETLKNAFESGHTNATLSLSKMTRTEIYYTNFRMGFHTLDPDYLGKDGTFNREGASLLFTTEVFGDVTGKSYLLISDEEFALLTHGIPDSKDPGINLKEEFAKELDNILSASVITRLSNELKRKMYGDIPILVGKVHGRIEDIIYDDFSEQAKDVYINSGHFSFSERPTLRPLFIWVVDRNSLNCLQSKPD